MDISSQLVTPKLLTIDEVAMALGVSWRTVHRAIQRKELVATRLGRSVRVRLDDLRVYLAAARAV